MPFAQQVVIVTGASSGIGRATALLFAAQHAHLTLVARGEVPLQEAAASCRDAGASSVEVEVCDVNDARALTRMVKATVSRHGRIDVVVHAAAVMAYGTLEELPADVYRKVVDTLVHGTANVARAVLPIFREQEAGSLVVVSSLLASIAAPLMGAYVTAKWGQLGLIRVLQLETRDVPGIRITAVAPGGVDTPIYYQAANVIGFEGRPPPPVYTPDRTAKKILKQVGSRRRLVQSGFANPLIIAGFRLTPAVFDRFVGPLLRFAGIARRTIDKTDGNVFEPQPSGNRVRGTSRAV